MFPETAYTLALLGAELLYPIAVGFEPQDNRIDSKDHWQRVIQGHAAVNMIVLIASNRIGIEKIDASEITFYGSAFITNWTGEKVKEAKRGKNVF
ncbi:MAG: nitrilase-related carbon-nitrogen hydrolase [Bacillaceae bacterium]